MPLADQAYLELTRDMRIEVTREQLVTKGVKIPKEFL
jgi:hypothetical protein